MASPNDYPNGLNLAGTVFSDGPATLQLGGRVYLSGLIQWLDTIDGNDANAGSLPELPVRTLAQAVTNSAANGVIVIGAGSSELLSGAQTISLAGLSIFGCGTGSSRPRYTCTGAVDMWNVTAAGVWIEGFYFPASTAASTARIEFTAANGTVRDCYFECGANDTSRSLQVGANANSTYIKGCSFAVTALRPRSGIEVTSAVSDLTVEECTFDGGSYGWSGGSLLLTSGTVTRVRHLGNTFINRSDMLFAATADTYQIYGLDMGGTGNVLLTA